MWLADRVLVVLDRALWYHISYDFGRHFELDRMNALPHLGASMQGFVKTMLVRRAAARED